MIHEVLGRKVIYTVSLYMEPIPLRANLLCKSSFMMQNFNLYLDARYVVTEDFMIIRSQ